jgi:outer membrane protein
VHPLPFLPNLKLNYTPLKFDGSGVTDRSFTFNGETFNASTQVDSKAEFNQLDVILFYNLLDTVVSVDAGLNIKVLDGSVKATERVGGASEDIDFTAPIPMLYGNVGFDVPTTNVKLGLEGSAIGYSGHRLTDFKASVRYTFIGVLGLEAGYRALNIKIDDLKDVSADIKVKGPYLGVAARF